MENQNNPSNNEKDKKTRIFYSVKESKRPIGLSVAISAVMTSLNAVVTVLLAVTLPLSTGFFNIGESMVYLTAIVFGPYIGAISGGSGGLLADIFLSYGEKNPKKFLIVLIAATIISVTILLIGFFLFRGEADFLRIFVDVYLFNVNFTYIFWSIIAVLSFLSIILIYRFVDPKISLKIIAMIVGGMEMIFGYFLFETFIPWIGLAGALSEIPFNIMQVCIGIAVAVSISEPIKNTLKL
ncbi:MAG: ECF transporter S component [Promethearchaeota archaeon]